MKVLFWNINKQNIIEEVKLLADEYQFDIIVLLECNASYGSILSVLNRDYNQYHIAAPYIESRFKIIIKFDRQHFTSLHDSSRWSIKRISLPSQKPMLLALLHIQSKVNYTEEEQKEEVRYLKQEIENREQELGYKRTIIVGDFNMNPFESGLVLSSCLNATMDSKIALRETRTVSGREYYYFYNPMWGFFGDLGKGNVSGTHYYNAKHLNYAWNIYDQVLIRPSLIEYFDFDFLNIITNSSQSSYINKNGLLDKNYSDHLPIKFSLNLK
jgi:hypothetical protein